MPLPKQISKLPRVAAEPINVFSHNQDLAGIAALLRQQLPTVQIHGPDEAWERITITGQKSWFRKTPTLIFKHDPDYYGGADWPQQVAGMQGYFSRFPDGPRKPDVLQLIQSFRFALATEFEPDLHLESNDPRLQFLFAVTRQLDGVIFTPSGLWDASGRTLLNAEGRSDANAVMPVTTQKPLTIVMPPLESNAGDEVEHAPPDAQRVARRTLCLAAIAGRGLLEVEEMPPEQAESNRKRLLTWVGELALEDELEAQELQCLQQPIGSFSQQAAVDASWRLEGLGVLAWALGKFEVPAYDQLVDAGTLLPAVGFLDPNHAPALLASPALRSAEELRKLKNQCFALHWRLRDFQLKPQAMDFRAFARESWFGPLNVSSVRFCENDLALGDRPISKASAEEFQKALSTANERHRAINWLVVGGASYAETDTST